MLAGYVLKEMLTATSVHLLNIYSVIINWRYNLKYGFLPGATSDFQLPLEGIGGKNNQYFALLRGASKGFMKALKAFIKPFEVPQRSVKVKI